MWGSGREEVKVIPVGFIQFSLSCCDHTSGLNKSCDWSVQLTVYLGKRDFVDHLDHVDPVGESGLVCVCFGVFREHGCCGAVLYLQQSEILIR